MRKHQEERSTKDVEKYSKLGVHWRCAPVFILLLVILLFFASPRYSGVFHNTYLMPELDMSSEPFDLFIISSYFYPNSTSLGDNAVALVVTGHYEATRLGIVTMIAWNGTHNAVDHLKIIRITPHNVCQWISMQMMGIALPNMSNLSLVLGNQYYPIPFKLPVYEKHEVVTCVAPLFANEQWQYALFAAHTYRRFGTYMHLYVRSMVTPLYDMLKEYEKEGYLRIQPWMRIKLRTVSEASFNPNINIEFRNQAAAQTDCLLQYKESAEFMAFMDLDDVLIPRLGKTYLDEFAYLFHSMPNVAFIHYTKENVKVKGQRDPEKFSISQMYSSIYFKQHSETGKMVTKPALLNGTWIHWPTYVPNNMERYDVPANLNAITHLKFMDEDTDATDSKKIRVPIFEPSTVAHNDTNFLLSKEDIEWIQADLERMMGNPVIAAVWKLLPKKFFYFNIILKCFNDTYYRFHYSGQVEKIKCPGPERCNFPMAPGFNCSNSHGQYMTSSNNTRLNIHYAISEHFRIEDGCRP